MHQPMNQPIQGICQLTLIPVRKEPSERSELVTQLIFGETFVVEDQKGDWILVKTDWDQYKGWISAKMATLPDHMPGSTDEKQFVHDVFGRMILPGKNPEYLYLPGGSEIYPGHTGFESLGMFFTFDPICEIFHQGSSADLTGTALKFLNAPYLWGGRTIFGIDCSGFTQIVFKMNGKVLPRDAGQQAQAGIPVNFPDEIQPGDLAFFHNPEGAIVHTGMMLNHSEIIHASGKVRIDNIDKRGILNRETGQYTHHLSHIQRI